ncbi:polysaccharide biosynthesis/export family protein [Bacteroides sp. AN502(2024)]|uniref:polysaccharide biosynthesis/export family protein n=1 Tax=Bacteroides sp. AN502(2024) TaxID=3160599 RepID=UPI003510E667
MGILVFLLSACGASHNIVYMQDIQPDVMVALQENKPITLQPGDKLRIVVHSRDNELAQMFNLNGGAQNLGGTNNASYYTIDKEGKIDMPILGLISAEGLSRMDLANLIKYRLVSGKLVRDPVVTVEFSNLSFYVLGEVNKPGRHLIDRDRVTLLEALAEAGDLSINGKRDNVLVLRTENDQQIPYRVDLRQASNIYASPVYYLKQNDMIYVEPTEVRANQSKLNANSARTPAFWFSIFSMLTSVILFITK